ncbi:MAG: 2'-5' RNA ligase [Actinobacteria bacterium 13_2_20CM_2_66_6]|nr:MAG: 2'-5' RNA ligase [Actinobacteria bacterium 13_2_20CM_2_66_6]
MLERYLAECVAKAAQFRWTPAANLHLTVGFMGHLEQSTAEEIADRLTASGPKSFDLELGDIGAFKRGRLARVVWVGLRKGIAESTAIASLVESECVRAGLEAETRPYHPHLTLARAKARDGAALPELPSLPRLDLWRAEELVLYRSRLGRAGSRPGTIGRRVRRSATLKKPGLSLDSSASPAPSRPSMIAPTAFASAICGDSAVAPSMRASAISRPPSSTTATVTRIPRSRAFACARAITSCAS